MADILLVYHGIYGQTRKVAECLQAELAKLGREADVVPILDLQKGGRVDPSRYGTIVIGAAIRNGKHNPAVYDFIARHRYRWFGRKEVCMVPTPELRARFL